MNSTVSRIYLPQVIRTGDPNFKIYGKKGTYDLLISGSDHAKSSECSLLSKVELGYSAVVCKSFVRKIERFYKSEYEEQESRNQFNNRGQQLEVQSNSDVGQAAKNNDVWCLNFLSRSHYMYIDAKFDVSNLFCSKLLKKNLWGVRLTPPPPLVKEGLKTLRELC